MPKINLFKKRRNRKVSVFDMQKGRYVSVSSGKELELINSQNELWREKHK